MNTVFIRVLETDDKAAALMAAIVGTDEANGAERFELDVSTFTSVPRAPFAYWLSARLRRVFVDVPGFASSARGAIGASTKNDFRYIRLATEILPSRIAGSREQTCAQKWVLLSKGGAFSKQYADVYLAINWLNDGRELKADISEYRGSRGWGYHWTAALNGYDDYFRSGLTWPSRTNGLSFRVLPAGCIFGAKGPGVFIDEARPDTLFALSAVLNSCVFKYFVSFQLARTELAQSYEVGVINSSPVPPLSPEDRLKLSRLARRAWSLRRSLDTSTEMSHAFSMPALLQVAGGTLAERVDAWAERVLAVEAELKLIQAEIDEHCFDLYDIDPADRRAVAESFPGIGDCSEPAAAYEESMGEDQDDDEAEGSVDLASLSAGLISWAVGVAVGRFDVRLSTGERALPDEPEPFEVLPVSSPGTLTDDDALPSYERSASYPSEASPVLVSDSGHPLDIGQRVRLLFDAVFGADADKWWTDVGAALGAKDGETGRWLNREFFGHHLRTYSKSRRKAPILWPIGTRSGSYLVWLYGHDISADSLFRVINDLLVPKLLAVERGLTQLRQDAGTSPTAAQRKAIDIQEVLLSELREFRELLESVAPLWAPDLDDGIVLSLAALWRVFAHHRAWSSELHKQWGKLAKGDYDWAHIAMRLWPERVIPKCGLDRSLAIAHGVEQLFWVRDPDHDGKWHRRQISDSLVSELIEQRRSPAVGAALVRMGTQ